MLDSSAELKIQNDDEYRLIWSILACLYFFENSKLGHSKLDELNFLGFDFTDRFKCSAVHDFEKEKKLPLKIFEIKYCKDKYFD